MFRKTRVEREKSKIEKRVETLPTSELVGWSETTLYSISRNLSSWQSSKDSFYLEEAKIGAEALLAVVNALHERGASERRF
jgi:hypothetical protein